MKRLVSWSVLGAGLLPLGYLVVLAAASAWPSPRLLPTALQWERFQIWTESGLASSLLLSLGIAWVVATLSTSLGLLASKQLSELPRLRGWMGFAYLPFALSPAVVGVCLLFFYIKLGLAGTTVGVVLAQTGVASAFAVLFLYGGWNPERRALAEAAATLGATPIQVWLKVLVPSTWPLTRVCFFQTFLLSWTQYGLTLVIGTGKVRTLPLRVYDFLFEADPGAAATAALLLVLPPLGLLWMERRVLERTLP